MPRDPAAGGKARSDALSPERRSEIASEAARKRWQPGGKCPTCHTAGGLAAEAVKPPGLKTVLSGSLGGMARFRVMVSGDCTVRELNLIISHLHVAHDAMVTDG